MLVVDLGLDDFAADISDRALLDSLVEKNERRWVNYVRFCKYIVTMTKSAYTQI